MAGRRKFIGQVVIRVGGEPGDLWRLEIAFDRRSDISFTTWHEIVEAVDAHARAFVERNRVNPRTLKQFVKEVSAEQAKNAVIIAQLKNLFSIMLHAEPAVLGQALYDMLVEINQDAEFERKNPTLQPKDVRQLRKLFSETYQEYRQFRKRLL